MKIRKVNFRCVGQAPLVFSKPICDSKADDETNDQFEERTWIQRAHVDEQGRLFRPGSEIHRILCNAGAWLSMRIKGEGKKTYTKRLQSGIRVGGTGNFVVCNGGGKPATVKDVVPLRLFVPSDGKRGGGKRVWRTFPSIRTGWTVDAELLIVDEAITEDVFTKHIVTGGLYDGMGSMRVGTGGPNGQFAVQNIKFADIRL